jgi:hypothetical protein
MKSTDTPRTDGQVGWAVSGRGICYTEAIYIHPQGGFVHASFARELERELTTALAEGLEQARLLGKSGEREAGLLARIEALERELATLKGDPRITMPDPLEHT